MLKLTKPNKMNNDFTKVNAYVGEGCKQAATNLSTNSNKNPQWIGNGCAAKIAGMSLGGGCSVGKNC